MANLMILFIICIAVRTFLCSMSVSPIDRHGRDALDFSICQVVRSWYAVPLTFLVKTRSGDDRCPDIVDVVVDTPLGTSDHCFVSSELCVEQSVPEYNIRSTVLPKHHTHWDFVRGAVRSLTWNTILKSF